MEGETIMKKTFLKKIVAGLATVAMVAGLVLAPATDAMAATTLWMTADFNSWPDAASTDTLTSTDGVTFTGTITLASNGKFAIQNTAGTWDSSVTITDWSGTGVDVNVENDGWGCDVIYITNVTAGEYTVTYNMTSQKLTLALNSTVEYTYDYYVQGAAAFEAHNWDNWTADQFGTTGKMTADGTTYTYTATTSADFDGSEGYDIVMIGTPDDDGEKSKEVKGHFTCDGSGAGTLTITYDSESGESVCTFRAADDTDTSDNTTAVFFVGLAMAAVVAVTVLKKRTATV